MPAEHVRVRIPLKEGSTATDFFGALRSYLDERPGRPWSAESLRPFVLRHASPRAERVAYRFERGEDGIDLRITGKNARLGLAYAVTLLTNPQIAEHVDHLRVEVS